MDYCRFEKSAHETTGQKGALLTGTFICVETGCAARRGRVEERKTVTKTENKNMGEKKKTFFALALRANENCSFCLKLGINSKCLATWPAPLQTLRPTLENE